ncbi:MAG: efflux RND transporter periplasmic adaptor subunit [Nitrospirota bacterium]|jgi:RND family efflux transporter MFP subunit
MRTLAPWIALLLYVSSAVPVEGAGEKPPAEVMPPALVVIAPVESGEVRVPLTLVGSAEPRYSSEVASEVDGVVAVVAARKGAAVKSGDVLVKLRTVPAELDLEEARGRVGEVEARIVKAAADVKRARRLFEQSFTSEEELQKAQADLDALRQQARQLRAVVARLEDRLARMTIRAPFAGWVVTERTEVGQWLGEGDIVAELTDLSVIHAMVPVPEQELSRIRLGMAVEIAFDALPAMPFTGRVTAIVPKADPAARSFPVEVSIDNPDGRILAGMLARATFRHDGEARVSSIPKDALVPQPGGGGYVVKVVDGAAAIVPVRVLESQEERFAVEGLQGELAPGDRVVIRGNERLRPGQPLREATAP